MDLESERESILLLFLGVQHRSLEEERQQKRSCLGVFIGFSAVSRQSD